MPSVQVFWWDGRTKEQKKDLIEGITKVFEDMGVPPHAVEVIINDIPKDNWGMGGKQASEI